MLKYFHLFFIALSSLMGIGVGAWAVNAYQASGQAQWIAFAALGFVSGAGLLVYGNRFFRKVRNLGIAGLLITGALAIPVEALACPACAAGSTDSVLRSGVNMGIVTLLAVTGLVLASFAAFFVYLARRARQVQGSAAEVPGSRFQVPVQESN
jgi:hypothetical protein